MQRTAVRRWYLHGGEIAVNHSGDRTSGRLGLRETPSARLAECPCLLPPPVSDRSSIPMRRSGGAALLEVLLIFAAFAVEAAWPAPDTNEPHYLGKAKHFWNQAWVPYDFFFDAPHGRAYPHLLESHEVFYLTTGWLSRCLTLAQFAWCGRLATCVLMACTWRRLSVALLPVRWSAPLSAALFVAPKQSFSNGRGMGRGRVRSQGIVLRCSIPGLGGVCRSPLSLGLRPVWHRVGVSCFSGGLVGTDCGRGLACRSGRSSGAATICGGDGLGTAVRVARFDTRAGANWGTAAATVREASELFVFRRAPHHLLPPRFATAGVVRFSLLFLCWVALCMRTPGRAELRRLNSFVLWAVAVAGVGIVVSWATWHHRNLAASILRYYWFRLADAACPWAWPLHGALVQASLARRSRRATWHMAVPIVIAALHLLTQARSDLSADRPRADAANKVIDPAGWRPACLWAGATRPKMRPS